MKVVGKAFLGFTLVELMVALAVMTVLLMVAVPSFVALRQRSTLNASGEQVLGLWNQARLEAAKRNQMVKFGVLSYNSGNSFCIGAGTTIFFNDTTPCDCSTNACDVLNYPENQKEWHSVTLAGTPTLGAGNGVIVIEPRRVSPTDPDNAGAITFNGPPGRYAYKLNFHIDRFGRGVLCESNAAAQKMPAYTTRRCDP
jgi:prepilin-type N-terminal cleavage/methylation domain-containing protein